MKVYIRNNFVCKCGWSLMYGSANADGQIKKMKCINDGCLNYNVEYKIPTIELEEVKVNVNSS